MKRRAGRKRKSGRRHPSGDLILEKRTRAQIAGAMPHRRGLKDPTSELAESELGRMALRGELEHVQALAGDLYRRQWRTYIASLSAPKLKAPASALDLGGGKSRCQDCDWPKIDFCLCEDRKRRWDETCAALADTGTTAIVDAVCLADRGDVREFVWMLRLGLNVLARHYGLTMKTNGVLGKAPSKTLGA